jgi:hypothetical protein
MLHRAETVENAINVPMKKWDKDVSILEQQLECFIGRTVSQNDTNMRRALGRLLILQVGFPSALVLAYWASIGGDGQNKEVETMDTALSTITASESVRLLFFEILVRNLGDDDIYSSNHSP